MSTANGTPVTGYLVVSRPAGARVRVDATATRATLRGLDNGTGYVFVVQALSDAGTSEPATSSRVVPYRPCFAQVSLHKVESWLYACFRIFRIRTIGQLRGSREFDSDASDLHIADTPVDCTLPTTVIRMLMSYVMQQKTTLRLCSWKHN